MSSALPSQPSLEQLKKQAKDLLAGHADRSPDCLSVLRHLHRFKDASDQTVFAADLKLSDAQFALAIDYGFKTWGELVHNIESRSGGLSERAAIAWARLRKSASLSNLIGGEPRSATDILAVFTTLEVEGPGGRFVVEEADPAEARSRLLRERQMGEFLNANGVQAPQITLLDVEGHNYGVHLKVEGIPADSVELSVDDLKEVAGQLASLLYRMHAVPLLEGCRILGWPAMSAEEAAVKCRFGGYLNVEVIENALADSLKADKKLMHIWKEVRGWLGAFVSEPADLVFGHGDLWLDKALLKKTDKGYRLSGVTHLINAGLMNLYDEFLRVASLGYYIEDKPLERAVIGAYNNLPGQSRPVNEIHLRYAIAAFWFYLAVEASAENRPRWLSNAVETRTRGVTRTGGARLPES